MHWNRRHILAGLAVSAWPGPAIAAGPKSAGEGFVTLEAAEAKRRLAAAPAVETAVWAYNGQVPGPMLRVKKGEAVKVRLVNKLAQPTSLCWHGVRIANAMDGVAGLTQPPVAPGASFDYTFTPPDAGLYWYHPHVFPSSAEQIGRGLYGVLLVEEAEPPKVDEDVLVVLDDWSLDAKGQIVDAGGKLGALVTVNAAAAPLTRTMRPGSRVRLRLLNACGARVAILGVAGAVPTIIALDGQPSEPLQPARATIPLGPGSRVELMLDLPAEAGRQLSLVLRGDGAPDLPLVVLTAKGEATGPHPPIARLPANPLLPIRIPLEKSLKRDLVIARVSPGATSRWAWTLDGVGSDGVSGKPLLAVKRGGAVTLAFVNKTDSVQQMHVHGHVFRVLHDLDDGWDPYWRESILVAPGRTKHVAFIADNPGKWAIESLMLDRQVSGLAGWFEVT